MALTPLKFSALSPVGAVTSATQFPVLEGSANKVASTNQVAGATAQRIQGRPLRIAFAGDSIALIFGQYQTSSPFFWSQVRSPRRWDYIGVGNAGGLVAISGNKSGTLKNAAGTTTYTAVDGTDLNTPAMIARLTAWKPDILVIEVGTNDSGYSPANDATFRNVRAVVEATGARHTIIFPILPRGGNISAAGWTAYNAYLLEWERTTPGIHIVRVESYMADTVNGVAGGSTGAVGAWTGEGLHPSIVFGREIEPLLSDILDEIGAPKIVPRAITAADVYSTDRPHLNVIDGTMSGTYNGGAYVPSPMAGVVAPGWTLGASGGQTELILTGSKSTMVVRGNTYDAQKLVVSATGALTGDRTAIMRCTKTLPAGTAYNGEAQVVIRIKDPVGILQVGYSIKGTVGGVPSQSFGMGSRFVTADANLLPTVDETLEYMIPGSLPFDPGTLIDIQIAITGKSGMTPSAEVYVGQADYRLLTGLPA